MSIGFVQRQRAFSGQRAVASSRNHHIERGRVFPTFGNLLFWRSVYQSQGKLWADEIGLNTLSAPRIVTGESIEVFTIADLPPTAREAPRIIDAIGKLNAFADGYIAVVPGGGSPASSTIFIGDMRYSRSPKSFSPLWGMKVDPENAIEPVAWVGWRTSAAEAIDKDGAFTK